MSLRLSRLSATPVRVVRIITRSINRPDPFLDCRTVLCYNRAAG